ncbi:MAG TPA: radical SAM protein, partial [Thermoleophilia bacterium]|nr:radical SAM protein [Thermoleophilia bacterium]
LERLLGELAALEPAPAWLRLLYLQPENVGKALLAALAEHAVRYLDVPFQHASARVLAAMQRWGDAEVYLALLERARLALPGVAVRSTFIAGFPGESDADFEELLSFVREAGLAVAGVFPFDPQEGTAAAALPGRLSRAETAARAAALAEAIESAAAPFWEGQVGRCVEVLVERGCRADGEALGRTSVQAPDIDGRTYLTGDRFRRGELIAAEVTQVLGFDLVASAAASADATRAESPPCPAVGSPEKKR